MKLELTERREVTRVVDGKETRIVESENYRIVSAAGQELGNVIIGQQNFSMSMYNQAVTAEQVASMLKTLEK